MVYPPLVPVPVPAFGKRGFSLLSKGIFQKLRVVHLLVLLGNVILTLDRTRQLNGIPGQRTMDTGVQPTISPTVVKDHKLQNTCTRYACAHV